MQDKQVDIKKYFMSVLGKLVESRRKTLSKSIYKISAEVSVPRSTWRDLEFCNSNDINLTNFCKIAEGLEIKPEKLLSELYKELGNNFSFIEADE